ncbi:hypothetical protein [Saccharothrix sp. S26]|uniref:hypothetical protein n=1 Tax=Saccharothrix sp. S26 TaxID=2907215 RepID=UPI001F36F7DD|nr:hypothetical protein [Saccharothrix sp. S26]
MTAALMTCLVVPFSAAAEPRTEPFDPHPTLSPQATGHVDDITSPSQDNRRPVWAIAHRVLMAYGVDAAAKHGANAIEVDACPSWRRSTWDADHDCTGFPSSRGDSMAKMMERAAHHKDKLAFVWLDLKSPDYCSDPRKYRYSCSMAGLRDMARRILLPAGVSVLYGFGAGAAGGNGWNDLLSERLLPGEAVAVSGTVQNVLWALAKHNTDAGKRKQFPANRTVMDHGLFELRFNFGDCENDGKICAELRRGSEWRDKGAFSHTFGWTIGPGDKAFAYNLLGKADVSGLIYGRAAKHYTDEQPVRDALGYITTWLSENSGTHRLAVAGQDRPWLT